MKERVLVFVGCLFLIVLTIFLQIFQRNAFDVDESVEAAFFNADTVSIADATVSSTGRMDGGYLCVGLCPM